jgi:hypothetical protein
MNDTSGTTVFAIEVFARKNFYSETIFLRILTGADKNGVRHNFGHKRGGVCKLARNVSG